MKNSNNNNDNKPKERRELARELKQLWNIKMAVIPIEIGALVMIPVRFIREMEKLEIGVGNRINRNHPSYSIIEIGQNTEKSSGDKKRLVITQMSVKNHNNSNNNKSRKQNREENQQYRYFKR